MVRTGGVTRRHGSAAAQMRRLVELRQLMGGADVAMRQRRGRRTRSMTRDRSVAEQKVNRALVRRILGYARAYKTLIIGTSSSPWSSCPCSASPSR